MLNRHEKIYVAGHRGMVGSAIIRQLKTQGYEQLLTASHKELDLVDQSAVAKFMQREQPNTVVLAAAKVGGIYANNIYPADFIYENLMMEANVIHQAYLSGVKKLLFLGSSCIYPKLAEQPMQENALLTGQLEATNEPYAIAKIAGIKLCESYNRQYSVDYRSVMPTNLYGPGDNFHLENSHVIPALICKFHQAKLNANKTVTIWGTGQVKREFLHVDDMAAACLHVMNLNQEQYAKQTNPMLSHLNVGTGSDIAIAELAQTIANVIGFEGELVYDSTKPDGTPRKLMDSSKLNSLGWEAKIELEEGLKSTYHWFLEHQGDYRT